MPTTPQSGLLTELCQGTTDFGVIDSTEPALPGLSGVSDGQRVVEQARALEELI